MIVTAVSDLHQKFPTDLPGGDLLIDAGDWTFTGRKDEILHYMEWMTKQLKKYRFAVFICGNHERTLCPYIGKPEEPLSWMKPYLSDRLIYLQQTSVEIEGVKIYGDAHNPEFGRWGYNWPRGRMHEHWDKIPPCDILITHSPPYGYGDQVPRRSWNHYLNQYVDDWERVGDEELLVALARIRPKYAIAGHLHSGRGKYEGKAKDGIEGVTIINAANCDEQYNMYPEKALQFEI